MRPSEGFGFALGTEVGVVGEGDRRALIPELSESEQNMSVGEGGVLVGLGCSSEPTLAEGLTGENVPDRCTRGSRRPVIRHAERPKAERRLEQRWHWRQSIFMPALPLNARHMAL